MFVAAGGSPRIKGSAGVVLLDQEMVLIQQIQARITTVTSEQEIRLRHILEAEAAGRPA